MKHPSEVRLRTVNLQSRRDSRALVPEAVASDTVEVGFWGASADSRASGNFLK